MAQVGAVNGQGSCARGCDLRHDRSWKCRGCSAMAQARIGQNYGRVAALTAELCKAQLRQWQSAAAVAGRLGASAEASLREEEGEVTIWPTPLPCIYRTKMSSRRVFPLYFSIFSELGPAGLPEIQKF